MTKFKILRLGGDPVASLKEGHTEGQSQRRRPCDDEPEARVLRSEAGAMLSSQAMQVVSAGGNPKNMNSPLGPPEGQRIA